MKDKKVLGIFAAVLIITSVMKLFGVSLQPLIHAYEGVGTAIMNWIALSFITETSGVGTKTLAIYIPLIILATIIIGGSRIFVLRRRASARSDSRVQEISDDSKD